MSPETKDSGQLYSQFIFEVEGDNISAGFQEVSGLGIEVTVTEYRDGTEMQNSPRKITGTFKVPDVTLKRGIIGALDLFEWIDQVRKGSPKAVRNITIKHRSPDRNEHIAWLLTNTRPIKYTGPSLNGKGTDVAIEELVLACEGIELEKGTE